MAKILESWKYASSAASSAAAKVYVLTLSELDALATALIQEGVHNQIIEEKRHYRVTGTEPIPACLVLTSAPNGTGFTDGFSNTPTNLTTLIQGAWDGSESSYSILQKGMMKYNSVADVWEIHFEVNLTKLINTLIKKFRTQSAGDRKEIRLVLALMNGNGITNPTTVTMEEQGIRSYESQQSRIEPLF